MLVTPRIKDIYAEIQKKIYYMIPEKWDRLYLYASVEEKINHMETGEMFFYYEPKGILKRNLVNVYEIPSKFNIEEDLYMELVEDLYKQIQLLRKEYMLAGEKLWSNLTIKIENFKFSVEYNYDDFAHSSYTSYDRHVIWRYQYLGIEPISKKDKKIINNYLFSIYHKQDTKDVYMEGIYEQPSSNMIEYGKEVIAIQKQDPYQDRIDQMREKLLWPKEEAKENKNQILSNIEK